jgi:hypothetical protein
MFDWLSGFFGRRRSVNCQCCGFLTCDERELGNYEICPVCFWEDDPVWPPLDDLEHYVGGANEVSLAQGRRNFLEVGACEQRCRAFTRQPRPWEKLATGPDPDAYFRHFERIAKRADE